MLQLSELKPGMRIKIVATPPKGSAFEPGNNPHQTEMGAYLNQIVTVTHVYERCVSIKEDHGKFAWTPMLIERVI